MMKRGGEKEEEKKRKREKTVIKDGSVPRKAEATPASETRKEGGRMREKALDRSMGAWVESDDDGACSEACKGLWGNY